LRTVEVLTLCGEIALGVSIGTPLVVGWESV
jgi:hypothetical protein